MRDEKPNKGNKKKTKRDRDNNNKNNNSNNDRNNNNNNSKDNSISNNNNNRTGTNKMRRRNNTSKYCWSCGAGNHDSNESIKMNICHKNNASFQHMMGGFTYFCQSANK